MKGLFPTQDQEQVREAVRALLGALGADPETGETALAPGLVAEAAPELYAGIGQDPATALHPLESRASTTVEIRNMWFMAFCPHHLLPYTGHASVRYAPRDGRVAGLGDFARALELASRRFVLQETLADSLTDAIRRRLDPVWVEVRLETVQLCLVARGARAVGSSVVTVARWPGTEMPGEGGSCGP